MPRRDSSINTSLSPRSSALSFEYTSQIIEASWNRVLTLAENPNTFQDDASLSDTVRREQTYDRERTMVQALDTLYALSCEPSGYLAFISTITQTLNHESPVAMAFLSHIIDKSALPSRETMAAVSRVILERLTPPPPSSGWNSLLFRQEGSYSGTPTALKLNATTLWSLLAEKFAGELAILLWSDSVGEFLVSRLSDAHEDMQVRLFSLIALEKFALTGAVKKAILRHDMCQILTSVAKECDLANQRIFLASPYSPVSALAPVPCAPPPSPRWLTEARIKKTKKRRWLRRMMKGWKHFWQKPPLIEDLVDDEDVRSMDSVKPRAAEEDVLLSLNSFDTGFIPPEGDLRTEWAHYIQLSHCARWSFDNVFGNGTKLACSWDLSHHKAMMNIFDATQHWKIGSSGLELRNDRPHFESIRATTGVKTGKWYYETLLLTNGIMQLGWATHRCRFAPEEGYGVGDDTNGFAFDTFRSAVWANGQAVYPRTDAKVQCRAGDVLGSFLDLDNGLCTYFVNGCDLGLTVEFEHPSTIAPNPGPGQSRQRWLHANDDPETLRRLRLSLYPAVSLTTHQHVILNLGDRPWIYPPPVSVKYRGISHAASAQDLDDPYKKRVMRHIRRTSERTASNNERMMTAAAAASSMTSTVVGCDDETRLKFDDAASAASSEATNTSDYDWDGPLCTICFSEPKTVMLMPCSHAGWGEKCARALTMCPLCHAAITERLPMDESATKTKGADCHPNNRRKEPNEHPSLPAVCG